MNILIINSGSSSIKFQLIKMPSENLIAQGLVERIGQDESKIKYKTNHIEQEILTNIKDHSQGLQLITKKLLDQEVGVIKNTKEIDIVGHRVVHGGDKFTQTTIINEKVKNAIKDLFSLAPLHNPANLTGIEVAEQLFPEAKQVAVFDTAFHQTIEKKVYKYAIPSVFLDKHKIRLYGFHGTSHKFVSEKAYEYLNNENAKIISIHLGNGCSITAINKRKSVDHSLGFAPINGLIMGTRSGDIDPSVIFYLINELGYSTKDVQDLLTKHSGMIGLTGMSDLRDIEENAINGNQDCKEALLMSAYRIKKYIGSYIAAMNGIDAIIFTGGIGENSDILRNLITSDLDYFGIKIDTEKNEKRIKSTREINTTDSKIKILIIPTNEELEIAKQSHKLILK